jgi:iron complex outermembrane recepter protein
MSKTPSVLLLRPTKLAFAVLVACQVAPMAQGAEPVVLAQVALEQIVVTARKHDENQLRAPLSVDVITPATMQAFHLTSLAELTSFSSNVTLFEDFAGAGIPTWVIRGVGLQDFNSNNTPTAGIYADGVYQVATVMGNAALFDVSQAEILKGPQGGLYGRNTTGGAVLLNSRRAVLGQQSGEFNLSYGRWQQAQATASFNLSINEQLAWRVATNIEDGRDGWQKSLATGDSHGEKQRADVRSWLSWQATDAVSVQWKLQGGQDDSDIALGRSIGLYTQDETGAYCSAILSGRRDDTNCINFGGVNRFKLGQVSLVENVASQARDGSVVLSSPLNTQSTDYISSLLDVNWQGEYVNAKSLTAYDHYDYGVALDLDGSNGEFGHRLSSSDIEVFSQELQLSSANTSDLRWLVGLVFSEEKFNEHRDFNLRDNFIIRLGLGKLNYLQETSSQALYGDFTYALTPQWDINATARYTNEDKQYRDGNFYQVATPPYYFVKNLNADYALSEHWSGAVTLSYTPAKNSLVYASISRAFKSGGFYGGFPFSRDEVDPYLEEMLIGKELGYKQYWPIAALNLKAAIFTYNYQDVQGFVRDINPLTGTGIDRLANQADARHKGAELEVQWRPSESWGAAATVGWLDARFKPTGLTTTNMLNQQVLPRGQRPYAPRWDGNLELNHLHRLANGFGLRWAANYHYMADSTGAQSSVVNAVVNDLPGFSTLAGSLTLGAKDERWTLQLWGKNLTDKVYRTRVKNDGLKSYVEFFGEPRSLGLTLNAHF